MAVFQAVLFQILLVIFFGPIEFAGGLDFRDDFLHSLATFGLERRPSTLRPL